MILLNSSNFFRFERRIYIPLPDVEARAFLFKNQLKKTPNNLTEEDYEYLANQTEGFNSYEKKKKFG